MLTADQIKVVIDTQLQRYSRRIAQLTSEIAKLRQQPIEGSLELKQRLSTLEKELADQQSRLNGLHDLQQAIEVAEGLSSN